MKRQIFTLLIAALMGTVLYGQSGNYGTGWNTQWSTYLLLDEDFSGFEFYGNWNNTDDSNSKHEGDSAAYIDTEASLKAIGSPDMIHYEFYQCAFAPEWEAAYYYKYANDGDDNTTPYSPPELSNGFVEISREREGDLTVMGHFIIDLSEIAFVEGVAFTHSSCGGTKRGLTMAVSTDGGSDWDTLNHGIFFVGAPEGNMPADWTYDCYESASGMVWDKGLYLGELVNPGDKVMIRFTQSGGYPQAVRIHDLKIYGDPLNIGVGQTRVDQIRISAFNGYIRLSEPADVQIYNTNGMLMRQAERVESLNIRDLPSGIYIVKAKTDRYFSTRKILN